MSPPIQRLHQLPYFEDSSVLFESIVHRPWSVFLDSGYPGSQQGRFAILACDPIVTLVTQFGETTITRAGIEEVSTADPFVLLKRELSIFATKTTHLPFNGGALGYFSYDLARSIEVLPIHALDAENIPEMAIGIYSWAVIVDHQQRTSWLVGQNISDDSWVALIQLFSALQPVALAKFKVTGDVCSNMTADEYACAFDKIKNYLREGDCYQVNLAQRFVANCTGDPWYAYRELRKLNPAPFAAYLNHPFAQVLCSSPERFLSVMDGQVQTKPIKGTRPRKLDSLEDQQQQENLSSSPKDRAENLMIVDLLRNDIGKNCRAGTVKVPELFAVESYATVHHLVSTITGVLDEDQHALDLLRSCFPGGSITGAPKIRAMEIIEELEPHRRGVYCGAIGYIGFNGNMDTNIAIRTLVSSAQTIRCWAGGGIVNDSVMAEEFQESFDKAEVLLRLLRQMQDEDR